MMIKIRFLTLFVSLLVPLSGIAELDTGIAAQGQPGVSGSAARERGLAALQESDYLSAAAEFQDAAARGDTQAIRHLGDMAFAGKGVAQSYEQAIHWYCRAALAADKDSVDRLAMIQLSSWSARLNEQGWETACEQWLAPAPPSAEHKTSPPPPEVNINIVVQPERERETPSVIYPPRYWRRENPRPRPPKPIQPREAPYPKGGVGR